MNMTRKDRNNQWRVIKNSLLKKTLHCYSEDIVSKKKDRTLSKKMRRRLKRLSDKEISGNDINVGSKGVKDELFY